MIDPDRPVRVFRNLKHGGYSIMQAGRLMASARQVRLADVEFRVRESGRRRMLGEGRRTLHAFAVGRLTDWVHADEARDLGAVTGRGVIYDPHRFDAFVDRHTEQPVTAANIVQLDERGVTCLGGDGEAGCTPAGAPLAAA